MQQLHASKKKKKGKKKGPVGPRCLVGLSLGWEKVLFGGTKIPQNSHSPP